MVDVKQEALLMRRSGIVFERQYVKPCMYTLPLRPPDMMATAQALGCCGLWSASPALKSANVSFRKSEAGEDMDSVLFPFGKQTPPTCYFLVLFWKT